MARRGIQVFLQDIFRHFFSCVVSSAYLELLIMYVSNILSMPLAHIARFVLNAECEVSKSKIITKF